jgi:antitoxin component of MazEF toxin-antitoxin module
VITRAKKWGNSLGLIVPAEIARRQNIRDGDYLEVEIRRRIPRPDELSGTWTFRRSLSDLMREMKEGWDDL